MNGVHIGMAVKEVEGVIQVDRMIIISLFQEETKVGVLVREQENHLELIPSPLNITEEVLQIEQFTTNLDHQIIIEEVDHPQESLMTTSEST